MQPERIEPAIGVRVAGAVFAIVGAGLLALATAGAWPFAPAGLASMAYGLRKWRVAAIAGDDDLVVRNSLRTHRMSWADVVDMGYHERDVSSRQWSLQSRRAGSIYTRAGRIVWVEATETSSIVLNGTHLSDPDGLGPPKLERLRRRWRLATHSAATNP